MEKWKRGLFILGEIMSAVWTGFNLALDTSPIFPDIEPRFLALAGFCLFVILIFIHIFTLDSQLNSKMPNIEQSGSPYVKDQVSARSVRQSALAIDGKLETTSYVKFCGVKFRNCPKRPTELNHAHDVRAELIYYDMEGKLLVGPIDGRWSESVGPKISTDIPSLRFTKMKSSGESNPLDLAVKYPGETFFYAYNNDSYFAPQISPFRLPDYKIDHKEVLVMVELIGSRVKLRKKYKIVNYDDDIEVHDVQSKRQEKRQRKRTPREGGVL